MPEKATALAWRGPLTFVPVLVTNPPRCWRSLRQTGHLVMGWPSLLGPSLRGTNSDAEVSKEARAAARSKLYLTSADTLGRFVSPEKAMAKRRMPGLPFGD